MTAANSLAASEPHVAPDRADHRFGARPAAERDGVVAGRVRPRETVLVDDVAVDRNHEAAGRPVDDEVVRLGARTVPVDAGRALVRVVARFALAGGAVAPDHLDAGVVVGALLDGHLPRVIAEAPEAGERGAVAHRDPLHVESEGRALALAEATHVEFEFAVRAGLDRVVDAAVERVALPALPGNDLAAALNADRGAVEERIEELESVVELADRLERGVGRPRRLLSLKRRLHAPGVRAVERES